MASRTRQHTPAPASSAAPARRGPRGADDSGADRSPGQDVAIGELAARTGVTVETIRYYERVGVLPRAPRASAGVSHAGYRRYSEAAVERLQFVRRARDLGFSLDEVRDLLALAASDPSRPCGEVDALARTHLAQVEEKIAQLSALRDELRRVISACRGGVGIGDCRILGALSGTAE